MYKMFLGVLAGFLVYVPAAFGDMMLSWNQFQGDGAHDGSVSISVAPASLQLSWTITASSLGAVSLAPTVVGDGSNLYFTALGPSTGLTATDQVYAANQSTGGVVWSYTRLASLSSYGGTASAPSLMGNNVYVQFAGHSAVNGVPLPTMVGINATTGQQSFATTYSAQWGYPNQPTVQGASVFGQAGYNAGMQGYNAVTGSTLWNTSLPIQNWYVPAADASNLYVYMGYASPSMGPAVGTLYAINQATGAIAYTIKNLGDTGYSPSTSNAKNVVLGAQNDALVASIESNKTYIVSFDLVHQSIRWQTQVNATGAMAVANGVVYVPSGNDIYLLNETTGSQIGVMQAPAGQNLAYNVIVTDNLIFAASATNTFAFDLLTGTEVWSTNSGGMLAWNGNSLVIDSGSQITAIASVPEPRRRIAFPNGYCAVDCGSRACSNLSHTCEYRQDLLNQLAGK